MRAEVVIGMVTIGLLLWSMFGDPKKTLGMARYFALRGRGKASYPMVRASYSKQAVRHIERVQMNSEPHLKGADFMIPGPPWEAAFPKEIADAVIRYGYRDFKVVGEAREIKLYARNPLGGGNRARRWAEERMRKANGKRIAKYRRKLGAGES